MDYFVNVRWNIRSLWFVTLFRCTEYVPLLDSTLTRWGEGSWRHKFDYIFIKNCRTQYLFCKLQFTMYFLCKQSFGYTNLYWRNMEDKSLDIYESFFQYPRIIFFFKCQYYIHFTDHKNLGFNSWSHIWFDSTLACNPFRHFCEADSLWLMDFISIYMKFLFVLSQHFFMWKK